VALSQSLKYCYFGDYFGYFGRFLTWKNWKIWLSGQLGLTMGRNKNWFWFFVL
jgi:hypothetical protein